MCCGDCDEFVHPVLLEEVVTQSPFGSVPWDLYLTVLSLFHREDEFVRTTIFFGELRVICDNAYRYGTVVDVIVNDEVLILTSLPFLDGLDRDWET